MIKALIDWLDDRTGCRALLHAALYEHIPGGARWRYAWGSTLVFAFSVQMITGFFLWACYSPSAQTAWESVYYIQFQMTGGWLLRGIHHFMAQAMIVLLVLHMAQVIIDGAYRAPREVNFWIGLLLLQVLLGLSLTGYLLPWDQKGYWATQVATNIAGIIPVIGPAIQRIALGGTEYGHLTLTRFFALHAGLLPFLMIVLIALHVMIFRRHGITVKKPHAGEDATFWVDQVLKDAIACLAVMLVVVLLVLLPWMTSGGAHPPGAELGAPADPSVSYAAARPEWYFLFLFQFLKLPAFAGPNEIYGALVIPGAVMMFFALMPLIGRWNLGHRFNVVFFVALLAGILFLTAQAFWSDHHDAAYRAAVVRAEEDSARAIELASSPSGIPLQGAVTLMRTDPLTQGPLLFAQNCASCHRYDGHDGTGLIPDAKTSPQTASDLKGFGSRAWMTGLLDPAKIVLPAYFGATKHAGGKMTKFVREELANANEDKLAQFRAVAAAVSAESQLKSQRKMDADDASLIQRGRDAIKLAGCLDCHTFRGSGDAFAPELTGYASRQWTIDFIRDPSHARFYAEENDRMPSFGAKQILSDAQIGLIVDWLRGEWYDPNAPVDQSLASQPATRE